MTNTTSERRAARDWAINLGTSPHATPEEKVAGLRAHIERFEEQLATAKGSEWWVAGVEACLANMRRRLAELTAG